jgi:serine protease Do
MNKIFQLEPLAFLTVLFGVLLLSAERAGCEEPNHASSEAQTHAKSLSNAFRSAVDRASPGLVSIYTIRGPRMTPQWRRLVAVNKAQLAEDEKRRPGFLAPRGPRDEQGSGIVIDDQGIILTCNHLIESADAIFVVLPDGRKFVTIEVQGDPISDLAVLRIKEADSLHEMQLGNSDDLQVGDWVVSLGNPFELNQSVSAGIVSATDRRVPDTYHPLIQNDAATNPGSSGGALLNLQGEVVGIITGGFSNSEGGGFQGIGLAIPINTAKQVIEELGQPVRSESAYLGCMTQMLSPSIANQLGIPVAGGLYVLDVEKDSAANLAGIEQGDIITHFAGKVIDATFRQNQLLNELIPNNIYTISVFRSGKLVEIDVKMGELPNRNINTPPGQIEEYSNCSSEHFDEKLGLGLDRLTEDLATQLQFSQKLEEGILVTYVAKRSLAYTEGISAGMIILRVNNHVIHGIDEYKYAMRTRQSKTPILILVQSNVRKHLVVVRQ